ncbi:MAG: hypothetical protein ACFFD4_17930 [Candidatus Odinarchaeota archaeon]
MEAFKDREMLNQHLQEKRRKGKSGFETAETPVESPSRARTIFHNSTAGLEEYRRELVRRRKKLREMERDR